MQFKRDKLWLNTKETKFGRSSRHPSSSPSDVRRNYSYPRPVDVSARVISSNDQSRQRSNATLTEGYQYYGSSYDSKVRLESRAERRETQRRRSQRNFAILCCSVVLLVLVAAHLWMQTSNSTAQTAIASSEAALVESLAMVADPIADTIQAVEDEINKPTATPIFATMDDLVIHLPVHVDDLTELAFHPASFNYAMAMETHLERLELERVRQQQGTGRDPAKQEASEDSFLVGSTFFMYRSGHNTAVTTAADVGAKAGATVLSPVTGTVRAIHSYELNGRLEDYEIHIAIEGFDDLEAVIIHVDNLMVEPGDELVAGVTEIAKVRDISGAVRSQLATYTAEGDVGNHVQVQINDITKDSYIARQKKLAQERGEH